MGFKMSAIMSGIGKGLESAGTIGMNFLAQSKLQTDRLAAEEQRALRLQDKAHASALELQTKKTASEEGMQGKQLTHEEKLATAKLAQDKWFQGKTLSLEGDRLDIEEAKVKQGAKALNLEERKNDALKAYQEITGKAAALEAKGKYEWYTKRDDMVAQGIASKLDLKQIDALKERIKSLDTQNKDPMITPQEKEMNDREIFRMSSTISAWKTGGEKPAELTLEQLAEKSEVDKMREGTKFSSAYKTLKNNPDILTDPQKREEFLTDTYDKLGGLKYGKEAIRRLEEESKKNAIIPNVGQPFGGHVVPKPTSPNTTKGGTF